MSNKRPNPYPFVTTHESPTDAHSADIRMQAQLEFESKGSRFTPRDLDIESGKIDPKSNTLKKTARTVLVAAGIAGAAYGIGGNPVGSEPKPVVRNVPNYDYPAHGVQPNFVAKPQESQQK